MRSTLLLWGLSALIVIQHGMGPERIDAERAIPRFILQKNAWVCVDRNPIQLNRRDCPSAKISADE
jgi:hypothetical protein